MYGGGHLALEFFQSGVFVGEGFGLELALQQHGVGAVLAVQSNQVVVAQLRHLHENPFNLDGEDIAALDDEHVVGASPDAVDAPIIKDTASGKAELYINLDQKIGEVPMVAGASVERSGVLAAWRVVVQVFTSPWLYIALGLLVTLVVGYVLLSAVHNRRRRRKRRRR